MLPALEGTAEQLARIEQDLHLLLTQPAAPRGCAHHHSLLQGATWRLRVAGVAAHLGQQFDVGELVLAGRTAAEEVVRLLFDPEVLFFLLLLLLLLCGLLFFLFFAETAELQLDMVVVPLLGLLLRLEHEVLTLLLLLHRFLLEVAS